MDISVDLSSDKYVFKDINRELIHKCLRYDSKYLIPLTKNKYIIDSVVYLECSYNITDLKGIENLTNLKYLDCTNNPLNPPYSGYIKKEQERLKQLK